MVYTLPAIAESMAQLAYSCPTCTRVFVASLDGKTAPAHKDSLTGELCPQFVTVYKVF